MHGKPPMDFDAVVRVKESDERLFLTCLALMLTQISQGILTGK